jgi:hypothetical protein
MTRSERIEEMCKILHTEEAKDAFRKAAALFPDYEVSGRSEDNPWEAKCAALSKDGVLIEFYS